MKKSLVFAALGLLALSTAACATGPSTSASAPQNYVMPISGSAPIARTSPLAGAFACVAEDIANSGQTARITVSQIKDDTGKFSYEGQGGGATVTQGGALMVMRALGVLDPDASNLRQVERYDMRVTEVETGLARQQLVRDGDAVRGLTAGMIDGSDYYITGSITEFNSNIQSGGAELEVSQIGMGQRTYIANVVVDLRLVRTSDLTFVGAPITIEKQIRGYETKAGIFNFFGDYLVDLNMGSNNQEPVQLAVRSALELAVLELAPRAVGASFDRCRAYANESFNSRALYPNFAPTA